MKRERSRMGPPDISSSEVVKGNVLGRGTFGVVYEGKCREQPVAIKVLHQQEFDDRKLKIFKQEVEVLRFGDLKTSFLFHHYKSFVQKIFF